MTDTPTTTPAEEIPGQLRLFDTDDPSREHDNELGRLESTYNETEEAFDDAA